MRQIPSAENLVAQVEGYIEDIENVLRITRIHILYQFKVPQGSRSGAERALAVYAEQCPAYQSVKECIECTWEADINEQD